MEGGDRLRVDDQRRLFLYAAPVDVVAELEAVVPGPRGGVELEPGVGPGGIVPQLRRFLRAGEDLYVPALEFGGEVALGDRGPVGAEAPQLLVDVDPLSARG